jgi:L-tryptophan---pyruvate aminotransferase
VLSILSKNSNLIDQIYEFLMVFTCRWALVKDPEVAKKMTKFIELNTIGVSKDSQLRAAKVLKAVSDSCEEDSQGGEESFFKYSYKALEQRWKLLRAAVDSGELFSLPEFSSAFCTFLNQESETQPGKQMINKFKYKHIF